MQKGAFRVNAEHAVVPRIKDIQIKKKTLRTAFVLSAVAVYGVIIRPQKAKVKRFFVISGEFYALSKNVRHI